MKLSEEQKALTLRALGMLAQAVGPQTAREVETLLDKIENGEVHVVRPRLMEDIKDHFAKLEELLAKQQATVKTYIDHVQRVCVHQFWKPEPSDRYRAFPRRIKLDHCRLCGKLAEPVTDTLRLVDD